MSWRNFVSTLRETAAVIRFVASLEPAPCAPSPAPRERVAAQPPGEGSPRQSIVASRPAARPLAAIAAGDGAWVTLIVSDADGQCRVGPFSLRFALALAGQIREGRPDATIAFAPLAAVFAGDPS